MLFKTYMSAYETSVYDQNQNICSHKTCGVVRIDVSDPIMTILKKISGKWHEDKTHFFWLDSRGALTD